MGNLPQHHSSHKQEAKSLGKLRELLPNDLFILRSEDGGDYGVDRILEVVSDGSVTNIRAHVQVKSQKKETKSDSVRFPVPINTINYLLNTIHSLFIIYSVDEDAFYWEWTRQIALSANAKQIDLESTNQKTFSYTFQKMLDTSAFEDIHKKLIADNHLLKDIEVDRRPLEKSLIESLQGTVTYRELILLYLQGKYEVVIGFVRDNSLDNPEINSLVSWCYYQTHNYQQALRFIVKALRKKSSDTQLLKMKAAILCDKGRKEQHKEMVKDAKAIMLDISRDSWGWDDYYNFGNMCAGLEDYSEALEYYKKALQGNPNDPRIWKNLSECYYYLKEHEKEMECLDKALELKPDLIEALISKAATLGNIFSEYHQAIKLLNKALRISENGYFDNSVIYYWLAKFHEDLGETQTALSLVGSGQQIYPGDKSLKSLKLSILINSWNKDEQIKKQAIQLLKELISRFPKDFGLRKELLKIYFEEKITKEAVLLIQESLELVGFNFSDEYVSNLEYEDLRILFNNMDSYMVYRESNNIGKEFFKNFDLKIKTLQKIEFKFAIQFAKLVDQIAPDLSKSKLISVLEKHLKEFIDLNKFCSELLIKKHKTDPVERQSEKMTQLVIVLPEVLLVEASRQMGWLLGQNNYDDNFKDQVLKELNHIEEWFDLSIEPIVKGAYNVIRWSE
ncbi:tetratricopeptide repeat protein [Fodinibius sp. Rm-B-1B1-1]|uniref:tetratricopeptide repeat protein n=1 Tax=Fodinibius alkaliphilus TaxID=3140241 RepID=UPI00315A9A90